MRIATLDDGSAQIDLIRKAIEAIGFECDVYPDEGSLFEALPLLACPLVVLDLRLPQVERLRWLRQIRQEFGPRMPVLAIAESSDDADLVDALSAGADDFMPKPLQMLQFQARVRALVRRAYPNLNETVLNYGPFRFFTLKRMVHLRGRQVVLKTREYDLALFMFKNIGRLLTREHLLDAVWNTHFESPTRSLDTHMSRLRTKLELRPDNGVLLSAVYGLGYRLEFMDAQIYPIGSGAAAAALRELREGRDDSEAAKASDDEPPPSAEPDPEPEAEPDPGDPPMASLPPNELASTGSRPEVPPPLASTPTPVARAHLRRPAAAVVVLPEAE